MSGSGERFRRAGETTPKPLLDAGGRPIVAHLVDRFPRDSRFVFVAREDHLRETSLRDVLASLAPGAAVVAIAPHRKGPVHAVLEAAAAVDPDLPTVVNYCDFSFSWDAEHFLAWALESGADGAIVTYTGFHPHHRGGARYAYSRVDRFGRVLEVREKSAFTGDPAGEHASTGTYFFRSGALCLEHHRGHAAGPPDVEGEHYTSMVMDHMVRSGRTVRVYEVDTFCQWGTPEDLADFRHWHAAFAALAASEGGPRPRDPGAALLLPMAGLGTRMAAFGPSKPLVRVTGEPMFRLAEACLPEPEHRILVALAKDAAAVREAAGPAPAEVLALDRPTDGEARTCDAASDLLRALPDGPLWITASDHALVLPPDRLDALRATGADLAVAGVRGYPPARLDARAYSWIDAAGDLEPVRAVGVKEPCGEYVLAGTFRFRSRRLYLDLLGRLLALPPGPGGERHLDAIVPLALSEGLDVRLLESPAFFCWGTPEALLEFRYWHRHFRGFRA